MNAYIVSAQKIVNGNGSTKETDDLALYLKNEGHKGALFTIDPLSVDWYSSLDRNHFRSGCAPVEALIEAKKNIEDKNFDYILISGKDKIKSDYSSDERRKKMNIYGKSIPSLYNSLAHSYINKLKITPERFREISRLLFENYLQSSDGKKPDSRWFNYLTDLFRGVDCANPVIDFEGLIIVANKDIRDKLKVDSLRIIGTGFSETRDGEDAIPEIKEFKHLKDAINSAIKESTIDFKGQFLGKNALMEIYTCYPVIPIAFLLESGFCSIKDIDFFLNQYRITVTGGMNLSKAPWNNPALNAAIEIFDVQFKEKKKYSLLHGNGGLGYKQGVVIMEACVHAS